MIFTHEAQAIQADTWFASVSCALAVAYEGIRILSAPKNSETVPSDSGSFLLTSDWFLPIYSAGILQWALFGIRTGNAAIYGPCVFQILILSPLLRLWFRRRVPA